MKIKPGARIPAAVTLTALFTVIGGAAAAVAVAAHPVRNATYSGRIARTSNVTYGISFKVSGSGKRVSNFTLSSGYPVYCQGGGFGVVQAASGAISKRGTFTVKLPIYFAPAHQHQGFVIITGSFAGHGRESGKVKTDFTRSATCNGTSSYKTTE